MKNNNTEKTETTLWDIVTKYYPNYDRCDDIALSDDLQKLLDKEQTEDDYAQEILESDYLGNIDNPHIKIDADLLNKTIYKKTFKAFIEMVYKELGRGFHPDTPFADYISIKNESNYFTNEKAQELQIEFDLLIEQFTNDEMYEIIDSVFRKHKPKKQATTNQTDKQQYFTIAEIEKVLQGLDPISKSQPDLISKVEFIEALQLLTI